MFTAEAPKPLFTPPFPSLRLGRGLFVSIFETEARIPAQRDRQPLKASLLGRRNRKSKIENRKFLGFVPFSFLIQIVHTSTDL